MSSKKSSTKKWLNVFLRILYPNWLSLEFVTEGWSYFFSQEIYNLSVFFTIVFLWHYLFYGLSVFDLLCSCLLVIGIRRYLAGGLCNSKKRLANQTVVITGANAGIGKETAKCLISRGARVILACRSLQRAESARREIARMGGNPEVRQLDLASLKSIRKFAEDIKRDNIKIHILINNAGLMCPYAETEDGFEVQMGTNHLGHFLLTNLLLPQMKHGEPARIINISSLAHLAGEIDVNNLMAKKESYDMGQVYANTKLANVLFTRHLAEILKGTNIQVFALHPGAVHSEFPRHMVNQLVSDYILSIFHKTGNEGAQTTIYCATEAKQHPDMYFSDCTVGWVLPEAKDGDLAEKLWRKSAQLVNLKQ